MKKVQALKPLNKKDEKLDEIDHIIEHMVSEMDFGLFSRIFLRNHVIPDGHKEPKTPEFHKEIYGELKKFHKYFLLICPRGHAKSTIITLIFVLFTAIFRMRKHIIIVSDSSDQADAFLQRIKDEIEHNEFIVERFGDLKGKTWSADHIVLRNGLCIKSRGQGKKIRGSIYRDKRPDLIILDDLENNEIVDNPDRRKKLKSWFFKEVLPAGDPDCRFIYVGTILHFDSLLMNLYDADNQWEKKFYSCYREDGSALWPDVMSLEKLDQIYRDFKSVGMQDAFSSEYMNNPIDSSTQWFTRDDFNYYHPFQLTTKPLRYFMTIDPAISKQTKADYTVVMVIARDDRNNIYVVEYDRGHYDPYETIDSIFRLHDKYKPEWVGIEAVAFQKALKHILEHEMPRRGQSFNVHDMLPEKDKFRITGILQPRFKVGQIHHLPEMNELEQELLQFPKATHDDVVDALAYAVREIDRAFGKEVFSPITGTWRERIDRLKGQSVNNEIGA